MLLYALRDPRTFEVRYIGKTTMSAERRLAYHLKPSELKHHNHRTHWLAELRDAGIKPIMQMLRDDTQVEEHLNVEEVSMIAFCRDAGFRLVNATDGGDGARGPKTDATREKLRRAATGKKASVETRMKMAQAPRPQWTEARRQKTVTSCKGKKKTTTIAVLAKRAAQKRVIVASDGRRFLGLDDAGLAFGVNKQMVHQHIHRRPYCRQDFNGVTLSYL